MNLEKIQEEKKAISPIIATLLLILIAIAAGVIVYAYVVGFIGGSTSNSGGSTSIIQITNFCMSATTNCNGGSLYVAMENTGSAAISISTSSPVELYFTDITQGTSTSVACPATSPTTININGAQSSVSISPGSTYTCTIATTGFLVGASYLNGASGNTVSLKVVNPDGGASTSSTKVIK